MNDSAYIPVWKPEARISEMLSLFVIHLNSPKQSHTVDGKHNGSESKICEEDKQDQDDSRVISLDSASQEGPEGVRCEDGS